MEASNLALHAPDPSLPGTYWSQLTLEDKMEFLKLRTKLHETQKASMKDRRLVSFSNEMATILKFLERDERCREQRCVLSGVAFAGPYICVNTRQLKSFLGRCKSSINGSLQQLGYVAVRTKSKARACVLAVMPILANDPNLLRQWTVRGASSDALFCFVSRFQPDPLPVILPEDLNEDKKITSTGSSNNSGSVQLQKINQIKNNTSKVLLQAQQNTLKNMIRNTLIQQPKKMMYDLDTSAFIDFGFNDSLIPSIKVAEMTPSISFDYLSAFVDENDSMWENDLQKDYENEWNIQSHRSVPRSQSTFFYSYHDWTFDDHPLFF